MSVSFDRKAKGPGKAEISELYAVSRGIYEKVLGFQVSMENSLLMKVS